MIHGVEGVWADCSAISMQFYTCSCGRVSIWLVLVRSPASCAVAHGRVEKGPSDRDLLGPGLKFFKSFMIFRLVQLGDAFVDLVFADAQAAALMAGDLQHLGSGEIARFQVDLYFKLIFPACDDGAQRKSTENGR